MANCSTELSSSPSPILFDTNENQSNDNSNNNANCLLTQKECESENENETSNETESISFTDTATISEENIDNKMEIVSDLVNQSKVLQDMLISSVNERDTSQKMTTSAIRRESEMKNLDKFLEEKRKERANNTNAIINLDDEDKEDDNDNTKMLISNTDGGSHSSSSSSTSSSNLKRKHDDSTTNNLSESTDDDLDSSKVRKIVGILKKNGSSETNETMTQTDDVSFPSSVNSSNQSSNSNVVSPTSVSLNNKKTAKTANLAINLTVFSKLAYRYTVDTVIRNAEHFNNTLNINLFGKLTKDKREYIMETAKIESNLADLYANELNMFSEQHFKNLSSIITEEDNTSNNKKIKFDEVTKIRTFSVNDLAVDSSNTLNDDLESTSSNKSSYDEIISENDATKFKPIQESLSISLRKFFFQQCINELFAAFNRKKILMNFPREAYKYFLATYNRILRIEILDQLNINFKKKAVNTSMLALRPGSSQNNSKDSTSTMATYQNNTSNNPSSNSISAVKKNETSFASFSLINSHKKQSNRFSIGGILIEFAKSPSTFVNQLEKSEPSDYEGIYFIVKYNMQVNSRLYTNGFNVIIPETEFRSLKLYPNVYNDEEYHKISLPNGGRRTFIAVNRDILLVYDNNQFILPTTAIEREFSSEFMDQLKTFPSIYEEFFGEKSTSDKNKLFILHVHLSQQTKIIDIFPYTILPSAPVEKFYKNDQSTSLEMVVDSDSKTDTDPLTQIDSELERILTLPYPKRLEFLESLTKIVPIVELKDEIYSNSHMLISQKPYNNFDLKIYYYFNKPSIVAAVIGRNINNALVAFRRNDSDDLEYKLDVSNTGVVSQLLSSEQTRSMNYILINNKHIPKEGNEIDTIYDPRLQKHVKIHNIPPAKENMLFYRTIYIEFLDHNKLGVYSPRASVSNVQSYKPTTKSGSSAGSLKDLEDIIINRPTVIQDIFDILVNKQKMDIFKPQLMLLKDHINMLG